MSLLYYVIVFCLYENTLQLADTHARSIHPICLLMQLIILQHSSHFAPLLHSKRTPPPTAAAPPSQRINAQYRIPTDSGVTDIARCLPALKAMAECGVLLLVHGEVTDPDVDMFDREAVFIDTKLVSESVCWQGRCGGSTLDCVARRLKVQRRRCCRIHPLSSSYILLTLTWQLLSNCRRRCRPPRPPLRLFTCCYPDLSHTQKPLLDQVPQLKVVMEHITTADAAHFVAGAPDNIAASVTPQHMLLNRNALFAVSSSAC